MVPAGNETLPNIYYLPYLFAQGRETYLQLLASFRTAHSAISLSPLLEHALDFRLEYRGEHGPTVRASGGLGGSEGGSGADGVAIVTDPFATIAAASSSSSAFGPSSGPASGSSSDSATVPAGVVARWRYALAPKQGPTAGVPVFSVSANSEFGFRGTPEAAFNNGRAVAMGRDAVDTSSGPSNGVGAPSQSSDVSNESGTAPPIAIHTLRDLTVNGRPALPADLLRRLGASGSGALLPLLGSTLVAVSEGALAPLQPAAAMAGMVAGRAGRAGFG